MTVSRTLLLLAFACFVTFPWFLLKIIKTKIIEIFNSKEISSKTYPHPPASSSSSSILISIVLIQ